MTQQIAVRLPDDLAAQIDRIAADRATDRSTLVVAALRREVRRDQQLRDIEVLRATGDNPYPDLAGAATWAATHAVQLDD